jgi:hypothetical protein
VTGAAYRLRSLLELRKAGVEGRAKVLRGAVRVAQEQAARAEASRQSLQAARQGAAAQEQAEWARALSAECRPQELLSQGRWRASVDASLKSQTAAVAEIEVEAAEASAAAEQARAALGVARQQELALLRHREAWAAGVKHAAECRAEEELAECHRAPRGGERS